MFVGDEEGAGPKGGSLQAKPAGRERGSENLNFDW